MFGQSLLSAFGIACTTDTDQLFTVPTSTASLATYELNSNANSIPYNQSVTSIATYQLNNATTSIPSNTYPGTPSNITYAAGKFGNAAVFNGSSSHVDFTSPIPDTNTAASFSCWFNMSTLHTSGYKSLIGAGNMTSGAGILSVLLRYASAGNYYIEPSRAFGSYTYYTATSNYSTVALSANTWYNVVYTYETSKQAKIYLNGVLVSTTSLTTTSGPATNSGVLALGQYRDSISASNWNGSIDQVRIFNTALPQAVVTALYNETTTTAQYDYVSYPVSYNGTASNITYAVGKFGNAAVFNGSSSEIVAASSILPSSGGFSISWWQKTTQADNTYSYTIDTGGGSLGNGIYIITHNVTTGLIIGFKNSSTFGSSSIPYTSSERTQWTHFCFSWDGTTSTDAFKIYKNNVATSFTSTVTNGGSAYPFRIGRSYNGTDWLGGSIDQVRIFNSALPQSAVTALYNETTTTAQSNNIDYQLANPNSIAYYKMSDATDQLGNYNGTATNVNFNTEGKFGFAGAFNGSSSRIETSKIVGLSDVSVSCWLKSTNTSSSERRGIIELNGDTSAGWAGTLSILYRYSDGAILVRSGNASSSEVDILTHTDISLRDGDWHNLIVTRNESTGVTTLYIDGSQADQETVSSTSTVGEGTLIGDRYTTSAGNYNWNGQIDQIRIYNSALSAANVTTLYNEIECEPVAINALDHFNTVLYTGNGGTQAITGVGFKPDFSWVKNRNTTGNPHELADVVRGVDNTLNSNTTSGEYNNATYQFNSFDTDGITVTDDTAGNYAVNGNNETYVAWNWKAPLANLSTGFNGSSSIITLPTALSDGTTIVANCISFWFNVGAEVTSSTTNNEIMTFAYSGGSSGKIALGSTSGSISNETFSVTSDVTTQYTYSRTNIPAGWNHAVVQWNSAAIKWDIYINGIAHTTYTYGTNEQGNFALKFGQRSTFYFNGSLNQIRLFNSILSASEISDLYAEPFESNNTLNYPAGAGCFAAYPLQTDAVDLSGNYNGASSNVTFGQPGYLTQNTEGTITSTVAANVDAGFSISKFTIPSSGSSVTVGHGLSSAPQLLIVKTTEKTGSWFVYTETTGASKEAYLELSNAWGTDINRWGNTAPTSSVFTLGSSWLNSTYSGAAIAYSFHSIDNYQKVGSYTGNGSATGPVVYLGFTPRFVLIKATTTDNGGGNWIIYDSARSTSNPRNKRLYADLNIAELSNSNYDLDFLTGATKGFQPKIGANYYGFNTLNVDYIYLAIA